jgi:CRISPR-associated endoribonuclease Cas6
LTFGLLLIGRAVEYLPYVIFAVSEMARHGLGAERASFNLTEVMMIDETGEKRVIYTAQGQRLALSCSAINSLSDLIRRRLGELISKDRLRIRFITPTRIRVDNDLQVSLSFELFVRNLLRRISMLALLHGRARLELDFRALISRAGEVKTVTSSLRWDDLERYSNRQKTKMKLGGFVGEVEYSGEAIEEFLPLVAAGEILHVGAGTSFGLGRYRIVAEDQV